MSCASVCAVHHPCCCPAAHRTLPSPLQIRALTRGEVDDADSGEGALKLLSELTVSVPELEALMGGVSLYEVEMAFEDSLRQLVGWGIYSFVAAVEVRGPKLLAAAAPAMPAAPHLSRLFCAPTPLRHTLLHPSLCSARAAA